VVRTQLLRLCGNEMGRATPENKIKEPIRQIGATLREDGGVSSYRLYIHNQPSPPEAYEELKREL
jgi:hypothetical protein